MDCTFCLTLYCIENRKSIDIYKDSEIPFLPVVGMHMTVEDCEMVVGVVHWSHELESLSIQFAEGFTHETVKDFDYNFKIWKDDGWEEE